ncbi:MAG: taurine dioxygenase [Parasphingorhabdus sp.]
MSPNQLEKNSTPEIALMNIKPFSPNCGALVDNIDLRNICAATAKQLAKALANHCVLFFRNQQLTPYQQKHLGESFGELHLHPAWPRLVEGHPEIMEIYADQHSTRIAGEVWHSDVTCAAEPPLGTILYMLQTPPIGGDTLFANMYAAFEALSAPIQALLMQLTAIHDGEPVYRRGYDGQTKHLDTYPCSEHPVVRTHPVSGRQALFVNRAFTTRIKQLKPKESDALLTMLLDHIELPLFQCRFPWQPGSIAFWDNRCTQHHALWDYYPHVRRGWRVTIKGDAPFFRA